MFCHEPISYGNISAIDVLINFTMNHNHFVWKKHSFLPNENSGQLPQSTTAMLMKFIQNQLCAFPHIPCIQQKNHSIALTHSLSAHIFSRSKWDRNIHACFVSHWFTVCVALNTKIHVRTWFLFCTTTLFFCQCTVRFHRATGDNLTILRNAQQYFLKKIQLLIFAGKQHRNLSSTILNNRRR